MNKDTTSTHVDVQNGYRLLPALTNAPVPVVQNTSLQTDDIDK